MHLFDASGGDLVETTTTGSDGSFLFHPKIGLEPVVDSFYLAFEAPGDLLFTTPNVGEDDTIDSDADVLLGTTETIEIASAWEVALDLDAGLRFPPLFADGFESGSTSAWSQ